MPTGKRAKDLQVIIESESSSDPYSLGDLKAALGDLSAVDAKLKKLRPPLRHTQQGIKGGGIVPLSHQKYFHL